MTDRTSLHPADLYLASLRSPQSQRSIASHLRTVTRLLTGNRLSDYNRFPWHRLRSWHLDRLYRRMRDKGVQPSTGNLRFTALRGVLRKCAELELIDAARLAELLRVRGFPPATQPSGRALTFFETQRLLEACASEKPRDRRDAAILTLLLSSGLRRAEVAALDLAHIDPAAHTLTVHAKGGRSRTTELSQNSLLALTGWLSLRGLAPGPLFCHIGRCGVPNVRKGLSHQAIFVLIRKRGEQAGLRPFTPHDLRRTCITQLLDNKTDLLVVSAIVGHASINTTARYDKRGRRTERAAKDALNVPYVPLPLHLYTTDVFGLFRPRELTP